MTLQLTSYVVCLEPKISVLPNFLSPEECTHLIDLAEQVGFSQSLVGRGSYSNSSSFSNQISTNRTSQSVTLDPRADRVVSEIELRLAGLVGLPVEHLESLVVVKYLPGQLFNDHHDGTFRSHTVFLYLNQVAAGGETRFPNLGLRIKPSMGAAVLWRNTMLDGSEDSRTVHAGLPPEGCVKFGVNCFFNQDRVREEGVSVCISNEDVISAGS